MGILSIHCHHLSLNLFITEASDKKKPHYILADFLFILKRWDLNRLNLGIFVLHATQIALFITIPYYLISKGGLAT